MNKMLILAIAFINGNLMTSLFLPLIQFINLTKVAEMKIPLVSIQIKF